MDSEILFEAVKIASYKKYMGLGKAVIQTNRHMQYVNVTMVTMKDGEKITSGPLTSIPVDQVASIHGYFTGTETHHLERDEPEKGAAFFDFTSGEHKLVEFRKSGEAGRPARLPRNEQIAEITKRVRTWSKADQQALINALISAL